MSHLHHEATGEWNEGFCAGVCGAESFATCLGAFCCPCFLHGRISSRYKAFPAEDDTMVNSSCAFWMGGWCCGLPWVVQLLRRQQMRQTFGIGGSSIKDCCASFWCMPCTLGQMNREVKARAEIARNDGGGYEKQAGGMNYAPQQAMGKKQDPVIAAYADNVAQGPVRT